MKKTFINSFAIKLIAIITMTIDHIGQLMLNFAIEYPMLETPGVVLKYIGRFAAPLFIFLAVEGALKSKNIGKYILRLGIIGGIILIGQTAAELMTSFGNSYMRMWDGNIFITLILIVFMIHCFQQKKLWYKLLGVLPIFYAIGAFACTAYEFVNNLSILVWWFPYMLRPQYDIFGVFLGLAFYLSTKLIDVLYSSYGMNPEFYRDTENYQFGKNALQVLGLIIVTLLHFAITFINPEIIWWREEIQVFSIVAGLVILFYNGRRGYNAKWFNICSYLYYPVHLVLLYGIFLLIFA